MAGETILIIDDEAAQREAVGGYLRELQNIVERAVVMARGPVVTRADLPVEVQPGCLRNTHGRLRRRKRR